MKSKDDIDRAVECYAESGKRVVEAFRDEERRSHDVIRWALLKCVLLIALGVFAICVTTFFF